jgi:hypothetical protein
MTLMTRYLSQKKQMRLLKGQYVKVQRAAKELRCQPNLVIISFCLSNSLGLDVSPQTQMSDILAGPARNIN